VDTNTVGVQDVVIGTLKTQDWLAATDLFRPLIGPRTVILPALNGVPWWYCHGEGGRNNGMHLVSLDPDRNSRIHGCFSDRSRCLIVANRQSPRAGTRARRWRGSSAYRQAFAGRRNGDRRSRRHSLRRLEQAARQ
jgi:hypothetical protein